MIALWRYCPFSKTTNPFPLARYGGWEWTNLCGGGRVFPTKKFNPWETR